MRAALFGEAGEDRLKAGLRTRLRRTEPGGREPVAASRRFVVPPHSGSLRAGFGRRVVFTRCVGVSSRGRQVGAGPPAEESGVSSRADRGGSRCRISRQPVLQVQRCNRRCNGVRSGAPQESDWARLGEGGAAAGGRWPAATARRGIRHRGFGVRASSFLLVPMLQRRDGHAHAPAWRNGVSADHAQ